MHRDMVCLIAFDFILRLIRVGVMRVSFVVDVVRVNPDDPAADTSGLGIPGHVITDRAVRDVVEIRCGAISGNMKVSFQAARSIG